MVATKADIRGWLNTLYATADYTHMVVKCDTYEPEDCCYPMYVKSGEDVRARIAENTDRTMEVYSKALSLEEQLSQRRAFNYE